MQCISFPHQSSTSNVSKTSSAQRVVELILADGETGSEGAEDDVSEYEDNVETNSDSNTEFEDKVRSEPPPEGTAQPTAGEPHSQ